jgi:hypothetical protein
LELPAGVEIVDLISIQDNGVDDQTYGGAGTTIVSNSNPNLYVPDAISRFRGNTTRSSAAAWFHGDLIAAGDDPLVYDAPNFALGLPVTGAALTPGEINVGTSVQSPLVSLVSVVPNLPVGTVTLNFSAPISQILDGGGAFGVSITGTTGQPVPGVDVVPTVTGIFGPTLTLSFSGSQVSGGQLPAGDYRLNFVGNSLIGNGRAVDTNGGAADPSGSNFSFNFTQTATPSADFDVDGDVDGRDFLAWQRGYGTPAAVKANGDADNDTDVDGSDLVVWQGQYGTVPPLVAPSVADDESSESATVTESLSFSASAWFALPGASVGPELATTFVADEAVSEVSYPDGVLADAFFATDSDDSSEELYSFFSEDEEEFAFDEVFADFAELALTI